MENDIYIHYGATVFDPDRFQPIQNEPLMAKPKGGLWASRIGASRGWKEWCADSGFRDCTDDNAFQFRLQETANVLYINFLADLHDLPRAEPVLADVKMPWVCLDFEKMLADGIDAIQVELGGNLYFALYGWDCDSTLVMNKDTITFP
jgi:hypothetical protein